MRNKFFIWELVPFAMPREKAMPSACNALIVELQQMCDFPLVAMLPVADWISIKTLASMACPLSGMKVKLRLIISVHILFLFCDV